MADVAQPPGAVAITGAGGGLGREVGLKLASDGYRIFGTALSQQEVMEVAAASGGKVSLTVTDITDAGAVKAWVSGVTQALGESGLDVLISNCRDPHARPARGASVAVRHEFEVNVSSASP